MMLKINISILEVLYQLFSADFRSNLSSVIMFTETIYKVSSEGAKVICALENLE